MKKYLAEMVGTMVLVLMGCGSAVFAGNIAAACGAGVGTLGVAIRPFCDCYGLYNWRYIGLPHQSGYYVGCMVV